MDLETKDTAQVLDICEHISVYKTSNKLLKTLIFGFFGGLYIALGAYGSVLAGSSIDNLSLQKIAAACVFGVGLMMIVIVGGELFTGNCLLFVGYFRKQISAKSLIKNLTIVWIANLIGALVVVFIAYLTHGLDQNSLNYLHKLALYKTSQGFSVTLIKAIGCNILVCIAVWMSYTSKDLASKILAIFFPIMLFIILGFDHVVANMYYLPLALISNLGISFSGVIINLIAATIGNVIGGGLVIAGLYYLACDKCSHKN